MGVSEITSKLSSMPYFYPIYSINGMSLEMSVKRTLKKFLKNGVLLTVWGLIAANLDPGQGSRGWAWFTMYPDSKHIQTNTQQTLDTFQ